MATCKDCVHVEVCRYYTNELAKANGIPLKLEEVERLLECDDCENFKARSRFVELPCKVGDTVYAYWDMDNPCSNYLHIIEGFIIDLVILVDRKNSVIGFRAGRTCEHNGRKCDIEFDLKDIGKTVFLTREEAERALSKRTQKKENEFYRGHCVSDDGKFCKHIKAAKRDNLSNDNTMSCEYGEVNCPYAKPLEEVNAK